VAEMLQNAGDISRQQKKQDRNANVIAGFLVIGVAAAAWAAKIVNVGGGLILGGLVAAAFVSLWYFFQNLDDEESRKVYGAASILSIGILASQIFWTLWYLFVLVMMMIGTIRCIRRQRQKKEKKCKTVLFTAIMATIMFVTLWQYQNTMQNRYKNTGIWRGAQQYAEVLLKRNKNLENDWLIGDESWREGNKNTFEIRLTYYADADDAKEGRESEYQYKIHFDDVDGYVIKSEGVPEKEIVFPENK
jgi:glucan phosphoethanolaminetransferase (alkaline phosphatase superfamily)